MNELQQRFDRQAREQHERRKLPWPEKIRLAEQLRDALIRLRKGKRAASPSHPPAGKS